MRRLISSAAALFVFFTASLPIVATAQSSLIVGTVTKVDAAANKITLRHGPIKKLDMDEGMTMVFAVRDPAMLKQVKAGDKVKFDADRVNGQLTVTKLRKSTR